MGINQAHEVGRQRRFYWAIEATKGTYQAPLTTDACKVIDASFDFEQPQEVRDDANEGQSDYELTPGKLSVPYSVQSYFHPSGTAGTAPNEGPGLLAAFGAQNVTGGVSVAYNFLETQLLSSLSMTQLFNAQDIISMEAIFGALLDEFTITIKGGEKPRMSWKGKAMGHIATGNALAQGSGGPGTTVNLQGTNQGFGFEVGSRVQVGANTGPGGTGNVLTAIAAGVITAGASSITYVNSDVVRPFAPAPTTLGTVIGHTVGSLTMDGVTFPITEMEFSIKRNIEFVEDEFGAAAMTDGIVGRRVCLGKIVVRGRADMVVELARRKQRTNRAITVVLGSGAGRIATLSLPQVRLDIKGRQVPQDKVSMIPMDFRALASAEGATNAASLTYT